MLRVVTMCKAAHFSSKCRSHSTCTATSRDKNIVIIKLCGAKGGGEAEQGIGCTTAKCICYITAHDIGGGGSDGQRTSVPILYLKGRGWGRWWGGEGGEG